MRRRVSEDYTRRVGVQGLYEKGGCPGTLREGWVSRDYMRRVGVQVPVSWWSLRQDLLLKLKHLETESIT